MRWWSVPLAVLVLAAPVTSRAEETPPAAKEAPAAAPAASPPSGDAAAQEDAVLGEVTSLPYGRSASYGATRVRGPQVNLTETAKGEWKGNIRTLDGVFKVTDTRISGANLNMVMERDGDEWICQGTVDGKRVRISMEKDGLVARSDNRLYDMKRVAPDLWAGVPTGPGVRVKGDAGKRDPMYPQFVLALLAVL